ncbi:MAG TPA: single-stranded DNA-binding protein [Acidimicrobiales bacterium]|nr:single-stranded DNA-binding protein [Acidimicrobiales bacterium]
MADNTITVAGNITRDPELKFLNSGQAAVRLSIAVNRRWQNRQTQEWEERVSYFEVAGYGALAENAANSLTKGTRVIVSGRLEQRSWETENGEKRSIVEINADEIAPSLRFATAVVTRTPRAEGSNFSAPERPAPRTNAPSSSSYEFDEEPF